MIKYVSKDVAHAKLKSFPSFPDFNANPDPFFNSHETVGVHDAVPKLAEAVQQTHHTERFRSHKGNTA